MSSADWLVVTLEIWYLIIMGAYIWDGDWKKAMYWFGAIIINIPVLLMRG